MRKKGYSILVVVIVIVCVVFFVIRKHYHTQAEINLANFSFLPVRRHCRRILLVYA